MEEYVKILYVAVGIIYILFTIIMAVVTWIKTLKSKNSEKIEELKNKTEKEIRDAAQSFIEEADQFKNYSNEEKLNYVITRLMKINQNLYDSNGLVKLTNELVEFTHNVNTNVKSKNGGKS